MGHTRLGSADIGSTDVPRNADLTGAREPRAHTALALLRLRRAVAILAFVVGLVLALAPASKAAPSDLDATFGTSGKVVGDLGADDRVAHGALQADGKLVVVGSTGTFDFGEFAVSRYDEGGSLDSSFSGDGTLTTDFGGAHESAEAVAIEGDGGIVVAGLSCPESADCEIAVSRYTSDGTLDATFSGDGRVTTTVPETGRSTGVDDVTIALQGDGKIVLVAGHAFSFCTPCNEDLLILRYDTDGSLDDTFSSDGVQTTDLSDDDVSNEQATAVEVQADGRILVAAQRFAESESCGFVGCNAPDFAVARFHTNGSLDTSFSDNGWTTTDLGGLDDVPTDIALQDDGKIVVVGETAFDVGEFAVARYETDGSADTSFSGDGKLTTAFGFGPDTAHSVALQDDGKVVVAGGAYEYFSDDGWDFGVARYNADGSLDTGFSGDGKLATPFGRVYDFPEVVLVQDDGKIVTAGDSCGGGDECDIAMARYEGGEGVPDTTPPDTTITSGPSGATSDSTPTFEFVSSEPESSFECRVDGATFAACTSPHTIAALAAGAHTFEVRAIDSGSNADPSPAMRSFAVQAPVAEQPSTGGGASGLVSQPRPAVNAPVSHACRTARTARKRAAKGLKTVQKKVRATEETTTKRKLRKLVKKRKVALRKATRRTKRACA